MILRRYQLESLEPRVLLSSLRFAVIGDYGDGGTAEGQVAARVKTWNPELVLTVGDNNYPFGAASTIDGNVGRFYQEFIGNYKGSYGAGSEVNRFFPSLGNHDYGHRVPDPEQAAGYLNYFTLPGNERYYDFVAGPVHFFCLDSDLNEPDGVTPASVQGQWLRDGLAASTSPWNLVYFHHSPYTSGSTHSFDTWMRWPFAEWGADAVFSGHEHSYERVIRPEDPMPYFVSGLGGVVRYPFGAPVDGSVVRYNDDFGAMKVEATDDEITFQFITHTGTLIDSYTLGNSTSTPIAPANLTAAAVSHRQIDLSWEDRSGIETGYTIERSPAGGPFAEIASVGPSVTAYSDLRLRGDTAYAYRVRATNPKGGPSDYSNSANASTPPGSIPPCVFVPLGATWKYRDNGSYPGNAWNEVNFNDAAWLSGPAELGYGDGDEETLVDFGGDADVRHPATWFRKAFTVPDPSAVTGLDLRLLRDDGVVVYLNGAEVFRNNMRAGAVGSTSLAYRAVDGADESAFYGATLDPGLLRAGNNVLAVEIHQVARDSDDISFDLELSDPCLPGAAPAELTATAVSDSRIDLHWEDRFTGETGFKIERSVNGINFTEIERVGPGVTSFSDGDRAPGTLYFYRVRAYDAGGDSPYANTSATTLPAGPVVGRHVFYNHSAFDGNDAAANALDDGAIAADKSALLPGMPAGFANYTSYSRGINGVMIDIAALPDGAVLSADDFIFRVGNDNGPSLWALAPAPTSISQRPGDGVGNSTRVTIVWPDGAIRNRWIQITVKPTLDTGLPLSDVFYFGNAVGESGNSATNTWVNAFDQAGARANPRTAANPAPIDFRWDFNRDGRVDVLDQTIARANPTNGLTDLNLITPPSLDMTAFVSVASPTVASFRQSRLDQLRRGVTSILLHD